MSHIFQQKLFRGRGHACACVLKLFCNDLICRIREAQLSFNPVSWSSFCSLCCIQKFLNSPWDAREEARAGAFFPPWAHIDHQALNKLHADSLIASIDHSNRHKHTQRHKQSFTSLHIEEKTSKLQPVTFWKVTVLTCVMWSDGKNAVKLKSKQVQPLH